MKKRIIDAMPSRAYLELKWWRHRLVRPKDFKKFQKRRSKIPTDGYSYKPFDEKKAIFIHIPKCAGVSVSLSLFGNLAGGHKTLDHYLDVFEPSNILNYFKFTIVRNPWDRIVSAYFFLARGGMDESDRNFFESELRVYSGFDEFVRKWLNVENIWKFDHFRPQYYYILDKDRKIPLDYIGRFETIGEDYNFIARRLQARPCLPRLNPSEHLEYEKYFTERTKRIVADVYSEDVDLLGYSF